MTNGPRSVRLAEYAAAHRLPHREDATNEDPGAASRNLIRLEQDFWQDHVKAGVMPEPDGSVAANDFINSYFKDSREDLCVPLLGFDEKLQRRQEIDQLMDKLKTEKLQIEQEVKMFMKEAEVAENDHFLVSWKRSISNRLDAKRLKQEMPEVYQRFCNQTASRRFLVRTAA